MMLRVTGRLTCRLGHSVINFRHKTRICIIQYYSSHITILRPHFIQTDRETWMVPRACLSPLTALSSQDSSYGRLYWWSSVPSRYAPTLFPLALRIIKVVGWAAGLSAPLDEVQVQVQLVAETARDGRPHLLCWEGDGREMAKNGVVTGFGLALLLLAICL